MSIWVVTIVGCIAAFLIGAVPFGLLLGKLNGIDVRKAGSGNIGAANVGRLLGRRWGTAVFALDMLKGFLPTLAMGKLILTRLVPAEGPLADMAWLLVGVCTVLGHNYSPFVGFRGGKGVATTFGVGLGVYPHLTIPSLVGGAIWATTIKSTGMSSLGSIAGAVSFPLVYLVLSALNGTPFNRQWPFLAFTSLMAILVLIRHRANIKRIIQGTEARFGQTRSHSESGVP